MDPINLITSLHSVNRSIKTAEKDEKDVRHVTLERSFSVPVEELWDAVTNPERLSRYFGYVNGELKENGRFQVKDNAEGTITECVRPQFFAVTWEFAGGLSWIEVQFAPVSTAETSLKLTHICPVDEHWMNYGPGAGGVGWDLVLIGLEAHLLDKNFNLTDGEALLTTKEGMNFIIGSSEDWGKAAIAAGENPEQAKAAAKRTTAFYTGTAE
ncbi:SRPBCC domain-containing protein [Alkalihalobacillus trypoxylicola]|uniref:Activator of Hsp90 ATPase homologue 1/2-like C-terminal domain-containing protein n=1 Tax=Alkalihalobacillus trypoxylicola TaxID=519424 RepID=A0A161PBG5_9BACI|nr:SRPBCC domain-containing protein [Alkalihalobacillus trypoxylicola]KYG29592.1 hypothetical protein AZF04_08745 [Alkalihalobacillus trypoxylicola]